MKRPRRLEVTEAQLDSLTQRIKRRSLEPADYETLQVVIDTVIFLSRTLQRKAASIKRLLRMIFGASTERTSEVLRRLKPSVEEGKDDGAKRKGHGRQGAADYSSADKVIVSHDRLKPADVCPDCSKGKLYDTRRPSVLLHLQAQPVITGTVFELEKLRCSACGKLFSAPAPPGAGREKFNTNVAPTLAAMRYGYGMPMNRLAQMQHDVGIPLSAGTQWELIQAHARELQPIFEELQRQAADADVLYNDDTPVRILSLTKELREEERHSAGDPKRRTGIFTTGIIATGAQRTFALFYSGRRHAGENLQALLDRRTTGLPVPIQMCDGLSRNKPLRTATDMANCSAHGRRGFATVAVVFPEECAHVLEVMQQVYKNDAATRREAMSDDQRLLFHQQHSAPLMNDLKRWLEEKLESCRVEPNSSLGEAINYIIKRWNPLTLFLRRSGAPLDNNICERALKIPIRHRNNSLFYKTENGARVGDLFMSIIQTCRSARVNPLNYLITLRRHAQWLRDRPSDWMPWNYQTTAAALASI
jgi:hypothetical protein